MNLVAKPSLTLGPHCGQFPTVNPRSSFGEAVLGQRANAGLCFSFSAC